MFLKQKYLSLLLALCLLCIQSMSASAQEDVRFTDIAQEAATGISYQRVPSASDAEFNQFKTESLNPATPYTFEKLLMSPLKSRGAPGTALLDYDNDGDLDIYVTNGPGASNSLYSNQLQESGALTFVDVADEAGVGVAAQDSTGVCYGDTDNDGDADLFVLGNSEPNRFFVNDGGQFLDSSETSGLSMDYLSSTSCAMGDINGDGLLDVAVVNNFDMTDQYALIVEPFGLNQPNQLFLNTGDNTFTDISDSSGIRTLYWDIPLPPTTPTLTWAVAMVDYDLDGDLDIIIADDQAGIQPNYILALPGVPEETLAVDRGYIRIMQNDGTGAFNDVTFDVNMNRFGAWMGFAFGDLNHDGQMDLFATNFGGYATQNFGGIFTSPSDFLSRWFLGQPDGSFVDPGVGELVATPFGWGVGALDLENDGDTDIIYQGGHDVGMFIDASTVALLENDGEATFSRNQSAYAESTNQTRRIVHGLATGDLNQDGFVDVVSVANMDEPAPLPQVPYRDLVGGPFDQDAFFIPIFAPLDETDPFTPFIWSGLELPNGSLAVDINSGDSGNHSLSVDTIGTVGLTDDGSVNRDGIGAVITVHPLRGQPAMSPVLGGSSYASQHELTQHFGLGESRKANVDILWPGGVRNRLYHAKQGTTVTFPEIPCSYDGDWQNSREYRKCVRHSLHQLTNAEVITLREMRKLYVGAIVAYYQHKYTYKIKAAAMAEENLDSLFVNIDELQQNEMDNSAVEFEYLDELIENEFNWDVNDYSLYLPLLAE